MCCFHGVGSEKNETMKLKQLTFRNRRIRQGTLNIEIETSKKNVEYFFCERVR